MENNRSMRSVINLKDLPLRCICINRYFSEYRQNMVRLPESFRKAPSVCRGRIKTRQLSQILHPMLFY